MINIYLFEYFASVILVSAILMITRKNPIHSVMFMLLLFFHIAGLFVMLNAEFLAAVQLIVYAGAIMILYLFVAMLLNVDREKAQARVNSYWTWSISLGAMIIAEIILIVNKGAFANPGGRRMLDPAALGIRKLGETLFQRYLVPFEVASILLLVGLVGAVMLAKKNNEEQ